MAGEAKPMESEFDPIFVPNIVDAPIEGRALGINEASAASHLMLSRRQESTGFAKDILTRAEEDVWNGL